MPSFFYGSVKVKSQVDGEGREWLLPWLSPRLIIVHILFHIAFIRSTRSPLSWHVRFSALFHVLYIWVFALLWQMSLFAGMVPKSSKLLELGFSNLLKWCNIILRLSLKVRGFLRKFSWWKLVYVQKYQIYWLTFTLSQLLDFCPPPRHISYPQSRPKSMPILLSFKISTIQIGQEHALQSSVVKKGRSAMKDWPFGIGYSNHLRFDLIRSSSENGRYKTRRLKLSEA